MLEKVAADRSVMLLDDRPFTGRVTICYCPPGALVAKQLVVPKKDFLAACAKLADELSAPSKSAELIEPSKT